MSKPDYSKAAATRKAALALETARREARQREARAAVDRVLRLEEDVAAAARRITQVQRTRAAAHEQLELPIR